MRQQVGSVALNLGSREGVGFDMGVGKMVSHFQAVKPSTEHFPGEKFSGRMEGRDEKGPHPEFSAACATVSQQMAVESLTKSA